MRRVRVRAGEVIPLLDGHAPLHHLRAARVDPGTVRVRQLRSGAGAGGCFCGVPVVMPANSTGLGGGSADAGAVGVGRAAVGVVVLAQVRTLSCRPGCGVVLVEAVGGGLVAGLREGVG